MKRPRNIQTCETHTDRPSQRRNEATSLILGLTNMQTFFLALCAYAIMVTGSLSVSWSWINGQRAQGASADYGTIGVPSASNNPGARSSSASFVNGSDQLLLFSGFHQCGAIVP